MSAYYDRSGRLRNSRSQGHDVRVDPDPNRPGHVVTVDEHGGVRTGPAGAWWTELRERPTHRVGDVLVTVELPSGRATAWNLALLAVEAGLAVWAHSCGVSWAAIAAAVGGVLVAGVMLVAWFVTVYTPRIQRRERARLHAAITARQVSAPAGTTHPTMAGTAPTSTNSAGRAA